MFSRSALFALLCVTMAGRAGAQERRPTGLPGTWTFNFDAGFGAFGFANSLYTNARPDPSGDLGDNWLESFIKPALSSTWDLKGGSQLFGKLSVVGERTFGAPPSLIGDDASSFKVEDLHVGWRSGKKLGKTENLLELTFGRAQYRIGHGMILWDGGGEGGSRGGFWSNARKAWEYAGIVRVKPKNHTFEAFYLDRDEVPEGDSKTRLFGGNYDLALGETTTLGASYLHFTADAAARPERDGLDVLNVRAYTAPLKKLPGLAFELEYVLEDNGSLLSSNAWTVQAAYQLGDKGWKPKLSYRYAFFQGDDPNTGDNEGFDALLPGFYDWGTWWQGEIAGEYFISNSNMISHQVRVHVTPSESLSGGLFGYAFSLDQPGSLGPGVTSKSLAIEFDAYADWKVNQNFIVSFIAAWADPQDAAEQAFGRTENFIYGMIYLAYAY